MNDVLTKRQRMKEERERIVEIKELFLDRPWRFEWKYSVPVQTKKTRKMFKEEEFQLIRPSLRREA